jgi:hypothetical protein
MEDECKCMHFGCGRSGCVVEMTDRLAEDVEPSSAWLVVQVDSMTAQWAHKRTPRDCAGFCEVAVGGAPSRGSFLAQTLARREHRQR